MMQTTHRTKPTTAQVHYKLYKAGKFWLVGTLATVSLVAGLATTRTASADTNSESSSDQDQLTTNESTATSSSVVLSSSSQSSTTASRTTDSGNSDTQTSVSKQEKITTDEKTTSNVQPNTDKVAQESSSESDQKQESSSKQGGDSGTNVNATTNPAAVSSGSSQTDNEPVTTNSPKATTSAGAEANNQLDLNETATGIDGSAVSAISLYSAKLDIASLLDTPATDVTDTPDEAASDATTITNDNDFTLARLSNFYLTLNGTNIPYNSTANAKLYPYVAEHWLAGQKLFNFYVILPKSITSTLDDMQAGANQYVTDLNQQENGFIQISDLLVSQLAPTTDGRQVFYFQPDAAAYVIKNDPRGVGKNGQPAMSAKIRTTDDSQYQKITFNNGTGTTIVGNDVILAGIGSNSAAYAPDNDYTAFPFSDASSGEPYPDQFVVGITNDLYIHNLKYVYLQVNDHYKVLETNTENYASTNYKGLIQLASGVAGSSYNPADNTKDPTTSTDSATFFKRYQTITNDFIKTHYVDKTLYWLPTLRYVGTTGNISETAVLPTQTTFEPTSLDLSGKSMNGNPFVYYVDPIKTALTATAAQTITATPGTWDPIANLTFSSPTGLNYAASSALTTSEGTLTTTISFTPADSTVSTVVDAVDTGKPGVYTVTYSYTDAQGNVTDVQNVTDAQGNVTTSPAATSITIKARPATGSGTGTNTGSSTSPDTEANKPDSNKPTTVTKPTQSGKPAKLPSQVNGTTTQTPATTMHDTGLQQTITQIADSGTPTSSVAFGGAADVSVANQHHQATGKNAGSAVQKTNNVRQATQAATAQQVASQVAQPATQQAATTLPQTNETTTSWLAQLGALLLALTSGLAFKRKRQ